MPVKINWADALKPLLKKYNGRKHPLDYQNHYQLLVLVVLSAQATDKQINDLAPAFFEAFPDIKSLAKATPEMLYKYLGKVRSFGKKTEWLLSIAQKIKHDKDIPLTMEALVALSGVGRKSANVILREAGKKAEGIIVDLHVVRVAPRLGIASGDDPKKIEKQMMEVLPESMWGETGMAISFLGREICRPTNPDHAKCVMNSVCEYFQSQ